MNKKIKQNKFPYIKANANSIANRKLVYGYGINDAEYTVCPVIGGKQIMCEFYNRWRRVLERVYCPKLHARRPTYRNATVCKNWLTFSVFREWMQKQDWEGNELDKDILSPGNKHYSPSTCCFVSREINSLLNNNVAKRGKYKVGVCWHKRIEKFTANINIHGKAKHLGCFDTKEAAYQAYILAKIAYIKTFQSSVSKEISDGLQRHIELLKKDKNEPHNQT